MAAPCYSEPGLHKEGTHLPLFIYTGKAGQNNRQSGTTTLT